MVAFISHDFEKLLIEPVCSVGQAFLPVGKPQKGQITTWVGHRGTDERLKAVEQAFLLHMQKGSLAIC